MLRGFGGCVGRTRRVAVAVGSITRALAFLGTYAHDQIPLSSRPALQTNEISWLPVIVLEMCKSIRAMACFFESWKWTNFAWTCWVARWGGHEWKGMVCMCDCCWAILIIGDLIMFVVIDGWIGF